MGNLSRPIKKAYKISLLMRLSFLVLASASAIEFGRSLAALELGWAALFSVATVALFIPFSKGEL